MKVLLELECSEGLPEVALFEGKSRRNTVIRVDVAAHDCGQQI